MVDRLRKINVKLNVEFDLSGSEPTHPRAAAPDDIETKLKLLTWSRPDLSTLCIPVATLRGKCPLDNSTGDKASGVSQDAGGAIPGPDLGLLDALPPELLQDVLSTVDIRNLTNLRAVNKRAWLVIDHLLHYGAVFENAPDALRFMLSTGAASYFILANLYGAWSTLKCFNLKCFNCRNFGDFLSVLTCQRYCYHCVEVPLSIVVSRVQYSLDQPSVFRQKVTLRLPGTYKKIDDRRSTCFYRKRTPLLSRSSAEQTVTAFKEADAAKHTSVANEETKKSIRYLASLLRGKGDVSTQFQAVVRFPALHRSTGGLEWGWSCQACQKGRVTSYSAKGATL
ncbi:MAG: hypothetical protein Q9210_006483 [Variospora velana]